MCSLVMRTLLISSFFFGFYLKLLYSYSTPLIAATPYMTLINDTPHSYELPAANLTTKYNIFRPTTLVLSFTFNILLSRETDGFGFACGFYCSIDYNYCSSYFFGIFIYFLESATLDYPVVWLANRDHPVSPNATLNFTAAGELVLRESDGSTVWSAGKSVASVNLTDTGNLVLLDLNNNVVWQSFDHPTDCLLPGQKFYEGKKLKSSVSLNDSLSQETGIYYLQVTDKGLFAYVESNPPQAYYQSLFVEKHTHKGRTYMTLLNGSFSPLTETRDDVDAILIPEATSAQYMRLMPDGHLQLFQWQYEDWKMVDDLTVDGLLEECGYPLVCGRNSICSANQQCSCPGIGEYFRPVNDRQLDMGCSEITPLTCNSTTQGHQHFITLENVTYFTLTADMKMVNMKTCKQACLNNCSCKAAFFRYDSDASNGECFLTSELFTMSSIDPFDAKGSTTAFVKVQDVPPRSTSRHPSPLPKRDNPSPSLKRDNGVATVVVSTIGASMFLLTLIIGSIVFMIRRKKNTELEEEYLDKLPGMPTRFSYEELRTATENFSKKLGQGGFGSVFEGTLEDGSKIAVKCLEGVAHVMKSFLAEIESIGSIHHVNLVRLRGFCAWRSQRLLVYEFMSNGSLDQWIYRGKTGQVLDWECRKKIVLEIARGLAYLHEDCRQKIIHLDIKPQNILLDIDFNAKVSDFGLSKLIERNQTEVMTSIKGTPGYIAPEWRSSIITEKMDVYSFGIVLLEILCGRKVFDRSEPDEESWYLLFVFQKCWEQGKLLDMVDHEDMQVHKSEVMEMMKMVAWCLQTNFKRRPSMSSVVKVLEGGMHVESNLDYNFIDPRIQETTVIEDKDLTPLSSFLLSGPR